MPRRLHRSAPKLTFDPRLDHLRSRVSKLWRSKVGENIYGVEDLAPSWDISTTVVGPGSLLHAALSLALERSPEDFMELRPPSDAKQAAHLMATDAVHWVGQAVPSSETRRLPLAEGRGTATTSAASPREGLVVTLGRWAGGEVPKDEKFCILLEGVARHIVPSQVVETLRSWTADCTANCEWVQIVDTCGWPRLILCSIPGVELAAGDELRSLPHPGQLESLDSTVREALVRAALEQRLTQSSLGPHAELRTRLDEVVAEGDLGLADVLEPICDGPPYSCQDCKLLNTFRSLHSTTFTFGGHPELKNLMHALVTIAIPGQLRIYRPFNDEGIGQDRLYLGIVVKIDPDYNYFTVVYPQDGDSEDIGLDDVLKALGKDLAAKRTRIRGHLSWTVIPKEAQCDECFLLLGEGVDAAVNCCSCSATVHYECVKFEGEPWEWKCKYCQGTVPLPSRTDDKPKDKKGVGQQRRKRRKSDS